MNRWLLLGVVLIAVAGATRLLSRRWHRNLDATQTTGMWTCWVAWSTGALVETAFGLHHGLAIRDGARTVDGRCSFTWSSSCVSATSWETAVLLGVTCLVVGLSVAALTGWLLSEVRRLVLRRRAQR